MEELDIVLDRGNTGNVIKLDQNEQDMLNSIEIESRPRKPFKKRSHRPQPVFNSSENIKAFSNPQKVSNTEPEDTSYLNDYQDSDDGGMEPEPEPQYYDEQTEEDIKAIDEEKSDILSKLSRLEKKGVRINKRLNMYSSLEELRSELKRASYGIEVDQALRFSKRMLVACVTGIEFLNKRYDPFDLKLEGWSESIMENTDDYDVVFEELYNKYKSNMKVAPELRLIMMLGGSAMMFHLTNSMFKTAIPNMNDVLKQNPDLVKNMMSAVQNTASRSAAGFEPPQSSNGVKEMQGPGIDISSLMNGIMMPPPPPVSTNVEVIEETESVSDIISISGQSDSDVKDLSLKTTKKRGRPRKKSENVVSI